MTMNIHYLMQMLSRNLHTMIRRYTFSGRLLETVCERPDLTDLTDTASLLLPLFDGEDPLLAGDENAVSYAVVSNGPKEDPDSNLFIIGPAGLGKYGQVIHRLPKRTYSSDWLKLIYICDVNQFIDAVLAVHNLSREETLSRSDFIRYNYLDRDTQNDIQREFSDIVFRNQENVSHHNPYDEEVREMNSIRAGDTDRLEKSWAEDYTGKLGVLAKDRLRNAKNLAIVLLAISSRAAIEGGLDAEVSFTLNDAYILKVEDAKTPEAASQISRDAEYHYTQLVHEVQSNASAQENIPDRRIRQCKDFIFSHLHEKIGLSDVAAALEINPRYLANLFKKEEGMTVGQYILNEKIRLARDLLTYSSYTYSEIAADLGFASQSHLGKRFREATGMTLRQYRETYGVTDYIS